MCWSGHDFHCFRQHLRAEATGKIIGQCRDCYAVVLLGFCYIQIGSSWWYQISRIQHIDNQQHRQRIHTIGRIHRKLVYAGSIATESVTTIQCEHRHSSRRVTRTSFNSKIIDDFIDTIVIDSDVRTQRLPFIHQCEIRVRLVTDNQEVVIFHLTVGAVAIRLWICQPVAGNICRKADADVRATIRQKAVGVETCPRKADHLRHRTPGHL